MIDGTRMPTAQYRIVRALRKMEPAGQRRRPSITAGAGEVAHILSFERDWPDSKVVRLEDNYRSRAPILALANTLIAHNSARHQKVLRAYRGDGEAPRFVRFDDENQEAQGIVGEIRRRLDPEGSERPKASDVAICFVPTSSARLRNGAGARHPLPTGRRSSFFVQKISDPLPISRLANPLDEYRCLPHTTPSRDRWPTGTSSGRRLRGAAWVATGGRDGSIRTAC
jgi:hypothetical protein